MEARGGEFSYADYLTWNDGNRWELYHGEAFMLAAPSTAHQIVSGELFRQAANFLRGKPCRVFAAPYDVRLFPEEDDEDDTVVQPDLLVVCDRGKIDSRCCKGPPDLVVEITSPSNTASEMSRKFHIYLEAGVREYWVVDPDLKAVTVHVLEGERYLSASYIGGASAPSAVLPGFSADLGALWSVLD